MADWTKGASRVLVLFGLSVQGTASAHQPSPDHHGQMPARAAQAMGFDQALTSHHFYLYEDGGAIEVTVKNRSDKKNLEAIRLHLSHLVQQFAKGDFQSPAAVHAQPVPGTNTSPGCAIASPTPTKTSATAGVCASRLVTRAR